ncbi:MAG: hypothetical protein V2I33_02505 [Kangiellaceae bacterium]|jgi:hypothetical protein|nr:hypothetical protein [Kangiellaceae bacterium]
MDSQLNSHTVVTRFKYYKRRILQVIFAIGLIIFGFTVAVNDQVELTELEYLFNPFVTTFDQPELPQKSSSWRT